MFSFQCFLENKEEIEYFMFSCTTPPGANPTQSLNLQTPVFLTNRAIFLLRKLVCLMDNPWTRFEIMQPSLDVLYIFAGSTSPVGLSAARLTGSFFRTQHTELKEKRVSMGNCTQTQNTVRHTYREPVTTVYLLWGSDLNILVPD